MKTLRNITLALTAVIAALTLTSCANSNDIDLGKYVGTSQADNGEITITENKETNPTEEATADTAETEKPAVTTAATTEKQPAVTIVTTTAKPIVTTAPPATVNTDRPVVATTTNPLSTTTVATTQPEPTVTDFDANGFPKNPQPAQHYTDSTGKTWIYNDIFGQWSESGPAYSYEFPDNYEGGVFGGDTILS